MKRRVWTAKDVRELKKLAGSKDAGGQHRPEVEENRGSNAAKSL